LRISPFNRFEFTTNKSVSHTNHDLQNVLRVLIGTIHNIYKGNGSSRLVFSL
jgi:hypothetical protein